MQVNRSLCGAVVVLAMAVGVVTGAEICEPIARGRFPSPLLKGNLDFRVFAPNVASDKALATVVYVKNLGIDRVGTLPDSELIEDFLNKGMLVVVVDYEKNPKARGADMYADVVYLYRVFGANRGTKPGSKTKTFPPLMDEFLKWNPEKIVTYEKFTANLGGRKIEYRIDPLWIYVIPAGYTIDRNIEVATIESELRKVVHRMDVIHPARGKYAVPAILEISTRMPISDAYFGEIRSGKTAREILADMEPQNPVMFTRLNRNSCYVFTWTMAGYAGVIMDNVANHVTSEWIYGKKMTVPTGPHFPEKRALRLLRARKHPWGLSGKVAIMGISKCNMRAIMAGLINSESRSDKYVSEANKGPYADQHDWFDLMIAGGFPARAEEHQSILEFLSKDDPALVWCQSVYQSRMKRTKYRQSLADKKAVLKQIETRCKSLGAPYVDFFGTPIGHDFDYVNLGDIINFADKYMKPPGRAGTRNTTGASRDAVHDPFGNNVSGVKSRY